MSRYFPIYWTGCTESTVCWQIPQYLTFISDSNLPTCNHLQPTNDKSNKYIGPEISNRSKSVTHSHIVPGAVTMMFNIQVREVEEHTVVGIHTDNPGTVHIVGIVARIQRRMDLPWWSCDWTSTACRKEDSWLKVTQSAGASGKTMQLVSDVFYLYVCICTVCMYVLLVMMVYPMLSVHSSHIAIHVTAASLWRMLPAST